MKARTQSSIKNIKMTSVVKRFEDRGVDSGPLVKELWDSGSDTSDVQPLKKAYEAYKDYRIPLSKDSEVNLSVKDKKITYKRSF